MDFDTCLPESVPINAVAVHRGDFVAEAGTPAGRQIQNNLLCPSEVEAIYDMQDAFHGKFLICHCCQTYSHQRKRRSSDCPARWAESFS